MVSFFELLGLALGSASLFGLIVGLFSIYNGRATRRLIVEEERRTQSLTADIRQLLEKNSEMTEGIKQVLVKNTEILERLSGKLLA